MKKTDPRRYWGGSLLQPNERNAARTGGLVLDCLRIVLTERGGSAPLHEGPGQIRQTEQRGLEFTLYDTRGTIPPEKILGLGGRPGEWLPESEFVDLVASDWLGREWRAEWVRPDVSGRWGEPGVIVRGALNELTCRRDDLSPKRSSLSMACLGDVEILTTGGTETITRRVGREGRSFSRDVWLIEGEAERVEIFRSDIGIDLFWAAEAPHEIPSGLDTRLEESLWLLTFQPLQWFMLDECTLSGQARTALRPQRDHSIRHRLGPPILPRQVQATADAGQLFLAFLHKSLLLTDPTYHPVTAHLRRVIHASARSIEDEALALGVAVERMLVDHFASLTGPRSGIAEGVDRLLAYLEGWTHDGTVLERAMGCIRQIKGPSARQALRRLVDAGLIGEKHRKAWNDVRHLAAHGAPIGDDIRAFVRNCDLVRELYVLLICDWLEYGGRLTQFTEMSWPLRTVAEIAAATAAPEPASGEDHHGTNFG